MIDRSYQDRNPIEIEATGDKTPCPSKRESSYDRDVKQRLARRPTHPAVSASPEAFRRLKVYVRELRALLIEAGSILERLILASSAEMIRRLCSRFYIVQEYFVMKYADARSCAVAALGYAKAALSFPA